MSKSPEQQPELYCGDNQLLFASFLERDDTGAKRKFYQFFYSPRDERGRKMIDYILAKDPDELAASDVTLFKGDIRHCRVVREIDETSSSGLVEVTYDLPRWLTPIEIRANANGFVHVHMHFPEIEKLASFGYKPDGSLAGAVLSQDQDITDESDIDESQRRYTTRVVEEFLQSHPHAAVDEIEEIEDEASVQWERLNTGKDTVAQIRDDRIYFYDGQAAYDDNTVGASEQLEIGTVYEYLGDKYRVDLDSTGRSMITETVRENGRKRVVAFPLNIGEACEQLRERNSFYWAQIPWLEDIHAEVTPSQ